MIFKDELGCLLQGLYFLIKHDPAEIFYWKNNDRVVVDTLREDDQLFPFLLVNVGTGVSIIKADSPTSFERISGSGLGGGTYWGLVRLMTKGRIANFQDSLKLSEQGDIRNVSMTVGDIYGGRGYMNLDVDMV